ncbi:ankyrin repeat [Fusarium globosum]|uniref:Ankyrin repeat n=1 Tax=Fusarium globosum TaxID=78864 RepID=A0A8H6DBE9_9HYPO|nr:ankyrin repeat [Fusarium globosum]
MDDSDTPSNKQSDQSLNSRDEPFTNITPDGETHLNERATIQAEGEDDDSISIQTTTDFLLPIAPDSETPPQEHKLGLDINKIRGWSGSEYDDYDVIAVHGIRDDYKTAWIDKKGGWILKEKLFKNMSIREIDYSYEIHGSSTLHRPNGIHILAQELVDRYAEERDLLAETETDRPIIWVCHDIGGTIVKEALLIASQNQAKYGKIFMHTTGIVFIGTPHRFESQDDAEDQILKLVLLSRPDIRGRDLMKAKYLAEQTDQINKRFLSTKILDRACVFNMISQSAIDSLSYKAADDQSEAADGCSYDITDPNTAVTPFRRNTHFIGHAFEASGRARSDTINHLDLIRDEGIAMLESTNETLERTGICLKVSYGLIPLQTRLLSLVPPTRALNIPFDPVLPFPPVLRWLHLQPPYLSFMKQEMGPNHLHIHGDGNPSVDIKEASRLLYAHLDSKAAHNDPNKTVIYFEFDQHDSRYRSLSSMLVYLINTILWHFWTTSEVLASKELAFLTDTKSWAVDDLYLIFAKLRYRLIVDQDLTFFISCFDQCPEDQRRWFMDRLLKENSYREASLRLIISTSSNDSLGIDRVTTNRHINVAECPLFDEPQEKLLLDLRPDLDDLLATRPVYGDFLSEIKNLLTDCHQMPQVARLLLRWLTFWHRGKNKAEISSIIASLSPANADNIVKVFIEHLPPVLQEKAKTAFHWIQHAMEPWSADALVEALTLYASPDEEPSLFDLDKKAQIDELTSALGGIITVENHDVKFCHPSFYQVTGLIGDESREEYVARIHKSMATTCLRYFQLDSAEAFINGLWSRSITGSPDEPLEPFVVYHQRDSMAEYAVRFWAEHYKLSGLFKPKELVRDLFAKRYYRARWEIAFWLLSNPFTRIGRHYISTLPIFAMLGLQDLMEEDILSERDLPSYTKDCWFAIIEAIRWGHTDIAKRLISLAEVDEGELQVALRWAAAKNDLEIIKDLLAKIPDLQSFSWPENLIDRAAAMGQEKLVSAMLISGYDVNKVGIYWEAPPTIIAAWRNQLSTLRILLKSEKKPDLSMTDGDGDSLLMSAARVGDPDLIRLVIDAIRGDEEVKADDSTREEVVRAALLNSAHRAIAVLLESGLGCIEINRDNEPFLRIAAFFGFSECVRVLLSHQVDLNAEWSGWTPIYTAVSKGYIRTVRLLLEHEPKPRLDMTPSGEDTILVRAIISGNVELVSLLIKHGALVDSIDENDMYNKTPLSRACSEGNLEMVKLLLERNADVNYTGGISDPPLFAAIYNRKLEVAKYLLENTKPDVEWKGPEGLGVLQAAYKYPEILSELLEIGSPIDGMSIWGTVLHMACEGFSESVQALLNNDPKPDLEVEMPDDAVVEDEIGYTPLQLACKACSFECVKALLEAGANPRVINRDGEDVVDILLGAPLESQDCGKCLRLLFSTPYDLPKERVDEEGRTRLHRIRQSTPVDVVRRFTSLISDLDVPDGKGYTPLAVAVSKGNIDVARYFIELGAKVNILSPQYGSILHIAVSNGAIDLAKLLIGSGADPEMVHLQYGESLMYTAIGISESGSRNRMIRYLADEAQVSISKAGGALGYPVIRAASMTIQPTGSPDLLKFFIRRKAQLDVTDNQGRNVVHFVSKSRFHDVFKILLRDKETINTPDNFGRTPVHFAASNPNPAYLDDLLNTGKIVDIDVKDLDRWTPLMWAARSRNHINMQRLLSEKAGIWVRSLSSDSGEGWSPLKLARFSGLRTGLEDLEPHPQQRSRLGQNALEEIWDDNFHKTKDGDHKYVPCSSCLVDIIGLMWRCMGCKEDFNLCFKCFPNRSSFHDPDHNFESIGPRYCEDADHESVASHVTKEEALIVDEAGLMSEEDNESGSDDLDLDSDS